MVFGASAMVSAGGGDISRRRLAVSSRIRPPSPSQAPVQVEEQHILTGTFF